MAKTWVLETQTKGTGANVVPLERQRAAEPVPGFVFRKLEPREAAEPRKPYRFKLGLSRPRRGIAGQLMAGFRERRGALRGVTQRFELGASREPL